MDTPNDDAIIVKTIKMDIGRMQLLISINDSAPLRTSPQIAQSILNAYPRMALHSCINSKGLMFSAVIEDTWLAHLLEHLIIDQQIAVIEEKYAADTAARNATFVGTTDRIGARDFKIEVNFIDDIVALQALHNALRIIDAAIHRLDT